MKKIIKKMKDFRIWYITMFKEHNHTKLNLHNKIRSIKYGFPSDLYKMYNLEKVDPNLYINEYVRMKTREIDGEYKVIMDNKLLFEKFFCQYVSIPASIIIICNELYDNKGNIINEDTIDKVLIDNKYIIKPASGTGGGTGVDLIKKIKNGTYLFNNQEMNCKEFYKSLLQYKNYIITEFVTQHEYSDKINPYSTNTIRIITLKDPKTNKFIIPNAIHRFGSKKSGVVDNASAGGFISNIDVETGTLLETKTFSDLTPLDIHPDTGVKINGTKIPHWEEIKNKLIVTASKFPYIPFIAWDVVVTANSFSIIEGNTSSGLNIFQIFGSIKDTKLGEFYKHYGYIK